MSRAWILNEINFLFIFFVCLAKTYCLSLMCQKTVTMIYFVFTQQLEIFSPGFIMYFKIYFSKMNLSNKSKWYLVLTIILFVGTLLVEFIWNKCYFNIETVQSHETRKCVCWFSSTSYVHCYQLVFLIMTSRE